MPHSFARPSVLPDISSTRGGIGASATHLLCITGNRRNHRRKRNLPPRGGDVRQDKEERREALPFAEAAGGLP